jgi:hypothetical protein
MIHGKFSWDEDPPDPCEGYPQYAGKAPLMSSIWGQGCYFNEDLGSCMSGGQCGKMWTGCGATAMGQIMNYWDEPSGDYNWSLILDEYWSFSTQSQRDEVSKLMLDIGNAVNTDWGCDESGTQVCTYIPNGFDELGYECSTCVEYHSSVIITDLNNNRPVLCRGYNDTGGHIWVCDGYNRTTICIFNNPWIHKYHTTYFHFNWGWRGELNGWFFNNNFDGLYTSNQDCIVSIQPK